MTWVKICGITNLEDATLAVEAGADALGFVFYEKSPRNVDPETARGIVAKLPPGVEKIGLFVDESAEKIASVADEAGLTAVQLHTDEKRGPGKQITKKKVFLSLPAYTIAFTEEKEGIAWKSPFEFPDNLAAIHLDSARIGGTGRAFDWQAIGPFVASMGHLYPIVVAGGLTPDNVAEAMRILRSWGVDVSSGVEAKPGKKDPEKVRAFIKAVRDADKCVAGRDSSPRSE